MADNLEIKIDVAAAKAALEDLKSSFTSFQSVAASSVDGASSAIERLNTAMGGIKAIRKNVLDSLTQFNAAINALQTGAIDAAGNALNTFGTKAAGVNTATNSVKQLGKALQTIQVPAGVSSITANFNQISTASMAVTKSVTTQNRAMAAMNNSIVGLATELQNAVGYMGNFGTTAGNIVKHLSEISQQGGTVRQVFAGLTQELGNFGAVTAVMAGVAVAVKGIGDAAKAVIAPIYETSTQFTNFKNTVDAMRGQGAGAEALEFLGKIATKTATDIGTLTKNYAEFTVSAKGANMSVAETNQIFEGFSVALRGVGATTQQTDQAFLALTQMMSKGQVQAQELKLQLGNALPGAMQLAARAMGMTTAELMKMMEAGKLLPQELLPAMAKLAQSDFGSAVAKQAETAQGQLTKLGNAVQNLLAAAGGDNETFGMMHGLANGIRDLAASLNTDGLRAFATALGELLGLLTGSVLSIIGGIVQAFTGWMNALVAIGGYLKSFVADNRAWAAVTETLSGFIAGLVSVVGALASGLATLGAAWVAYRGYVMAAAAANGAFGASLVGMNIGSILSGALTTAQVALAAYRSELTVTAGAMNALKVVATALGAVLRINPWVALAAAVVGVGTAIYTAGTSFGWWGSETAKASEAAKNAEVVTRGYSDTLKDFTNGLGVTTQTIVEGATAYSTYDQAVKDAKTSIELYKMEIKEISNVQRENQNSLKEAKLAHDNYINGIKSSNAALQSRKTALDQEAQGYKNQIASIKQSAQATKEQGASLGAVNALVDLYKGKLSSVSQNVREVTNAMNDNKNAISNSNAAYAESENRHKSWGMAVERSKDEIKKLEEALQQWGVPLNESSQGLAQQMIQFGQSKEEASKLAFEYEHLTKSSADLMSELEAQASKNKAAADMFDGLIQKGRQQIEMYEQMKAQQPGRAAFWDSEISRGQATIRRMTEVRDSYAKLGAQQQALVDAPKYSGGIEESAAAQAKELAAEYNIMTDGTEVAKGALDTMAKSAESAANKLGQTTQGVQDVGSKASSAADEIKKPGEAAKDSADKAAGTSSTWATVKTALSSVAEGGKQIGDAFRSLLEGAQNISTTLPMVADALPRIQTAIDGVMTNLPAFVGNFDTLDASASSMYSSLPTIATAIQDIGASIQTASPLVVPFSDALNKIGEVAPSIEATRDAVQTMIEYLTTAATQISEVTTNVGSLGTSLEQVKGGFDTASAGASSFESQLSSLYNAISRLIDHMNDLKKAAEEALAASQKASSSSTTAGSGRYGGLSGSLPESQTVSSSAFRGAPAFRDGTANTSRYISKVSGGGIPSILHPNEAVVPLPKGRSIPVDLSYSNLPTAQQTAVKTPSVDLSPVAKVANALQTNTTVLSAMVKQMAIDNAKSPEPKTPEVIRTTQPTLVPSLEELNTPRPNAANGNTVSSPDGLVSPSANVTTEPEYSRRTTDSKANHIEVNIQVNAQDADSFNRSQDQISRALQTKISRAVRRLS